ncbi:MAG: NADH-quinone oxidoreductase subunit J [Elusimicrobia bacterium]|nr:NADH-quinone oxidoreductase subunit J [Elusimicrobiota bacterium]
MTLWAVVIAGAAAVVFAAAMLWSRSLYNGAVCLLVVLLQTALIYVLRGAPLLGLLQVMIYAGAVMVLTVITIMASGGASAAERFADFALPRGLAALGVAAVAAEIALTLAGAPPRAAAVAAPGLTAAFGGDLFHSYALATEAVTLLMFLAALAVLPDKEPS